MRLLGFGSRQKDRRRLVGSGQYAVPFIVSMTGIAGASASDTASTTGSGILTLCGDQLTADISFSGLSGPGSAGRLNGPATVVAGSVNIPLTVPSASFGRIQQTVSLTSAQVDLLLRGQISVTLRTVQNPGDEIRGQIVADPTRRRTDDLVFQGSDLRLGIWFMDGFNLKIASPLSPAGSGGTRRVVSPR